MHPPRISALILAAGLSSRMGRFKPLLPLSRTTMIQAVISLFRDGGIDDIVVVTGHNHDRLAPVIGAAGARPLFNPNFQRGMFSSVQHGVAGLARGEGFFLIPADMPAVRPSTLGALSRAFQGDPTRPVIPEFNGKTGHPPLIPSRLRPAIAKGTDHLRSILFSEASNPLILSVHDRGILMDADTPDAFGKVRAKYAARDIPDPQECQSILQREIGDNTALAAHLERVAGVALTLARAAMTGPLPVELNLDLIRAGALLHDIKKGVPHHAKAARDFLLEVGLPGPAAVAAGHMDLDPGPALDEIQVVYFADKICRGHRLELDYPARFHGKAKTHPHAGERIMNRLETARRIQARIETAAGRSLRSLLQ